MTGIDRRVFTTFTDPTLKPGYPKRLGSGGEAPTRYADLNGDNVQELIVPTEDGTIHAYEPDGSRAEGLAGADRNAAVGARAHRLARAGRAGPAARASARAGDRRPRRQRQRRRDHGRRHTRLRLAQPTASPWRASPCPPNAAFCAPSLETDQQPPQVRLSRHARRSRTWKASRRSRTSSSRASTATSTPGRPTASRSRATRSRWSTPCEAAAGTQMVAESINEPAIADLNRLGPRRRRRRHQRGLRRASATAATSASPASHRRPRAPAGACTRSTGRPANCCLAGRSRCRASSRTRCRSSARARTLRSPRSAARR